MMLPNADRGAITCPDDIFTRTLEKKNYELTDHLGNVRSVITDMKLPDGNDKFLPEATTRTYYYPFGMERPLMTASTGTQSYRYGYNGMEKDNAVSPTGVTGANYSTDFREIDTRIGRWWSRDPIVKPCESPYVTFGDNPIAFADPSGLDPVGDGGNSPNTANISEGCDTDPKIPEVRVKAVEIVAAKPTPEEKAQARSEMLEKNANLFIWHDNLKLERDEQDAKVRTTDATINGLYIGFGIAVALPVIASAGITVAGSSTAATFIGKGLINASIDLGAQLTFNGGKINKVNIPSLFGSFAFGNITSIRGLLAKSLLSNGLEFNLDGEYRGFDLDINNDIGVLGKVAISAALDLGLGYGQNINGNVTWQKLSRNMSLSSRKPAAALWMKNYMQRQTASNIMNTEYFEFGKEYFDNALTNF